MTLVPVADRSRLISFHGGPRYPGDWAYPAAHALYTPPRNTLDPRYVACTDHHPACDCREAEFAENAHEQAGYHRELREAFDEVLVGHPTRQLCGDGGCQCTGCQIARAVHIWPRTAVLS